MPLYVYILYGVDLLLHEYLTAVVVNKPTHYFIPSIEKQVVYLEFKLSIQDRSARIFRSVRKVDSYTYRHDVSISIFYN